MSIKLFPLLFGAIIMISACSPKSEKPIIATIGFEACEAGDLTQINKNGITIQAEPDNIRIYPKKGKTTANSLHIVCGESKSVEIINQSDIAAKYLSFSAERNIQLQEQIY